MGDYKAIANQFTNFYYATFDAGRANLQPLYRPSSMLSWENEDILGVDAIVAKLTGLPFEKVVHKMTTMDSQPTGTQFGVIVFVTGQLLVDDGQNPLPFSQVFHLQSEDGASYYVQNDIFRLNLG